MKAIEQRKLEESGCVAHIRSLKRPEEVTHLRRRFGKRFFLIGVHASHDRRVIELVRAIEQKERTSHVEMARAGAEYLIERDERENRKFGQDVRGTFQLADAIVSGETPEQLEAQLARLLRVLFRHPFETPTLDETGMMHAAVAARQSAALGRQVGAAAYNCSGDLLATGYNEVPAVGGGHVRPVHT